MRIISKKTLLDFGGKHADSNQALLTWHKDTESSSWKSPKDIKRTYPSASIIPGNRIVFNIKGNSYRLVVKINDDYGIIYIRFIGTHSDYDKIDVTTI